MSGDGGSTRIGHAVIVGTIASTIAIFLFVGLGMWAITGNVGGGFALGLFCAAWGGPGFGVMVGGVMSALQDEKAALEARSIHVAVEPPEDKAA